MFIVLFKSLGKFWLVFREVIPISCNVSPELKFVKFWGRKQCTMLLKESLGLTASSSGLNSLYAAVAVQFRVPWCNFHFLSQGTPGTQILLNFTPGPKGKFAFHCIFTLQFSKVRVRHGVPGVPCHGAIES